MITFVAILELGTVIAALSAGLLWLRASRRRIRRVGRDEIFDHADFNRMVVALNRVQILNARAALATAIAALLAGASLVFHLAMFDS
ncbi:hypothetical protein [Pelagerythrobacter aerophilus]|uniref:hypothetical protein n=1 Tax=Pelagerythrobacter aerophilus TaxID=2306995 RepID=UPI001E4850B1|nr:hypothetical protein [Pelagerythrobacter aerophilus]